MNMMNFKLMGRAQTKFINAFRKFPIELPAEILEALFFSMGKRPQESFEDKPLVVIEGVEDPLFFALYSLIGHELKNRLNVDIAVLFVRSINGAFGSNLFAQASRSLINNWLTIAPWVRVYSRFLGPVAYKSKSFLNAFLDFRSLIEAQILWRNLMTGDSIANLVIDDIKVGDLVIDTYLRFKPSPFFDIKDPFVKSIIKQAVLDIRLAKKYFSKKRPRLYLSSYSTYTMHGIPVRVALSLNIPTYVYGNISAVGKRLSQADFYHTPNVDEYKFNFSKLDQLSDRLISSELKLRERLSGRVDVLTSYMHKSAYHDTGIEIPDVSGAAVIFLHDFYDSPHIYDGLIFDDFWSWISCTIETLTEAKIKFWIKPHPNQIKLSSEVVNALCRKYNNLKILPAGVTNTALCKAGIACGITVYGTVAHELAYLGVSSIAACKKHPHHSFDFCRTPKGVEEYKEFLRNAYVKHMNIDEMKQQSLAFFYMHNLYGDADYLDFREQYSVLWKIFNQIKSNECDLLNELVKMKKLVGWDNHINKLVKEVIKK